MPRDRLRNWTAGFAVMLAALTAAAPAPAQSPRPPAALPLSLPRYDLDIDLDLPAHQARVRQRVTWTNTSSRPVSELVFNAHSHYVAPFADKVILAKTLEMLRVNPDEGIPGDTPPLDLKAVRLGELPLDFSYQGDTSTDLVVLLPGPVQPGQAVTVDLEFTLHLPQKQGRWGQWKDVTFLSNWLPVVAVRDDSGWHPTPFVAWHQPFCNEAGIYHACVRLPEGQKVGCTGTVTGVRSLGDGRQELTIDAPGVREFSLLCSARYVEVCRETRACPGGAPVRVRVLCLPGHEHYAAVMADVAAEVIPTYGEWMGPYPWTDFTITEAFFGWNGNECSTLVMIDERVFGMPHVGQGYVEYLIAHETCHQWWYNLIGTNGYAETWTDESMAVYMAHRYLDRKFGRNSKMVRYPRGLDWLPNIRRDTYRFSSMYGAFGRGDNAPCVQDMPRYGHVFNLFSMAYDKGSKIVGLIADRLGDPAFLDFQHRLCERYAYRILRVADLQRELEEYTGQSWEEFFRNWLHGSGLADWSVTKVKVEPLPGAGSRGFPWQAKTLTEALRRDDRPCRVTVWLQQKGEFDERTSVGFCLSEDGQEDGRTPYQVRVPVVPGAGLIESADPPARVQMLPDRTACVQVDLPCRPRQIAVDPDGLLVDPNPANNCWRPCPKIRVTPAYTLLDETDLTTEYDRWNVIAGPWLFLTTSNSPWYTRSTMAGLRAGLYRTQTFNGGIYGAYRTDYRDFVVGGDALCDHWPFPRTQVGVNAETRLMSYFDSDIHHPTRGVVYGRYIFQYTASMYMPPMHYLEAFASGQENFLPTPEQEPRGGRRYDATALGGLHYYRNYLTPYWYPKFGYWIDATVSGGSFRPIIGAAWLPTYQATGQFSAVKGLPDLSDYAGDGLAGHVFGPALRWLGDTVLAARVYGAAALPGDGEFFPLGGSTLFRGLTIQDRQGSLVWLGSLEWRVPLAEQVQYDCLDHVAGVRNIYGAVFYDVGDSYLKGQSFGPVAHGVGCGLRVDVTWFGFIERTTLRFDVAKAVNIDRPVQFSFGATVPF